MWGRWVRQVHRWASLAFALGVAAVFVALGLGEPPASLYVVPLPPLALLLLTGLWLFAQPHLARWRGGWRTAGRREAGRPQAGRAG